MAVRIVYPQEEGKDERSQDTTIEVGSVTGTYQRIDFSQIVYLFAEMVREEVRAMEARMIERIDRRIDELVERGNLEEGEGEVIVLRTIPREQAKKEILDLLDKYDKLYYGDIAEQLRLDLEQVVEIVGELEKEGKIEEAK